MDPLRIGSLGRSCAATLLACLAVASLAVACGAPTEPVAAPSQPASAMVPVAPVVVTPVEPEAKDGEPVIKVGTTKQLLAAIGSNRTIVVQPGTYELSSVPHRSGEHIRWDDVHDGEELVIHGVQNLTIEAARDDRPIILAEPRYAWVIKLEGVAKVTLDNLVLGHTPAGGCTGGVVGVSDSSDVTIKRSDLFGSGTVGVGLSRVSGFRFESSAIRECTYGIAEIDRSSDVAFVDSEMTANGEYDLVTLAASPEVVFRGCRLHDNHINKGFGHVFFKLDESSSLAVVDSQLENNDFETLTNRRDRVSISGQAGDAAKLAALDPQLNQIYALARYDRWVVAGTQAGLVFWNAKSGSIDKLVKAFIANELVVHGAHLFAMTHQQVIRFDGLEEKAYLANNTSRGGQLVTTPAGELFAFLDGSAASANLWWRYDSGGERFETAGGGYRKTPQALGGFAIDGAYDIATRKQDTWAVQFLRAVVRHHGGRTDVMPVGGPAYPGRDPRSFHVDDQGKLWVIDFEDGFFRFDDATGDFARQSPIRDKGSAMAIDSRRSRSWFLHYTRGLHLERPNASGHFFDLGQLEYMRALLLDRDGSVWVGGWNALVHIEPRADGSFEKTVLEATSDRLAQGVKPL